MSLGEDVVGGVRYRMRRIGSQLTRIDVVNRTYRHETGLYTSTLSLSENTFFHPTYSLNRLSFIWDAYKISSELIQEHHHDLVVVQDAVTGGMIGWLLRRRFGIPLSITHYGSHLDNPYWLQESSVHRLANRISHWTLKRADTVRVDSVASKNTLITMGLPAERVWSFPMFIGDLEHWKNRGNGQAIREKYKIGDDPLLLWVGRFVPPKNLPNLVDAFAILQKHLPNAKCLLVGDGPCQDQIIKYIQQLNLNSSFILTGVVAHDNLSDYYAACDVFIMSSNHEGTARVLIEAAGSARPIVATRVGNTEEVVGDGETGILVDPSSAADLAKACHRILIDKELAARMGEAGREKVLRQYSEDMLVAKYVEMWEFTARLKADI